MFKAFIFDLDGVIVSTDELHYKSWKAIADRENIPFDKTVNDRLRGVSRTESLEIILEKAGRTYTDEEKAALAAAKNDLYVRSLSSLSQKDVAEGFFPLMKTLKENNILCAVGSSSKNTKTILRHLGITEYFDRIADGTDIERSKPCPDVFLKAAEKLNVDPSVCLVVEDARSGIDAGVAAGMKTAGINSAATYEKTTYPISSLFDLIPIAEEK